MTNRSDNENKYWDADSKARWSPMESPKPKVTTHIAGHTITVEYRTVNRKCYDCLATPTRNITFDGKRISLADLLRNINK